MKSRCGKMSSNKSELWCRNRGSCNNTNNNRGGVCRNNWNFRATCDFSSLLHFKFFNFETHTVPSRIPSWNLHFSMSQFHFIFQTTPHRIILAKNTFCWSVFPYGRDKLGSERKIAFNFKDLIFIWLPYCSKGLSIFYVGQKSLKFRTKGPLKQ